MYTAHKSLCNKEVIKCPEFVKPVNSNIYPYEKNKLLKWIHFLKKSKWEVETFIRLG
jgi:hypothetical protein